LGVQFRYQYALNAIALRISHDEALQANGFPGVKNVFADELNQPDTDMGPTLIGAPSIWNGDTIGGVATKGEGIVIGMIDSGINSEHPSFEEEGDDGYLIVNPYGAGVFHGWCVANPTFCNNKLIGAYGLNPAGGSPEDTDGHGSHTGAAGNALNTASMLVSNHLRAISGVAPHANIGIQSMQSGLSGIAPIAAVEHAIIVTVDVINFSISGVIIPGD
jgi:subtilisin family serine protease